MSREDVRAYYAGFDTREWDRLLDPADGALEFAVTCHNLEKYLPPNGQILDIGGGPGRYAIWLAEHGYEVVLADLSPNLLDLARTRLAEAGQTARISEIVVADVCDLGRWTDASFDAVVCLGPFYHLPVKEDRLRAVKELRRVLKKGGPAFIALMPRFTFLRRTIIVPAERRHLQQPEFMARLLTHGEFYNDVPGKFTSGYGVDPGEVKPFFAALGFEALNLLAAEGFGGGVQESLTEMAQSDPVSYQLVLDLIVQTAADPSILGASNHLLYIGRAI